jgi:Xaa-Pro aminopeptidase
VDHQLRRRALAARLGDLDVDALLVTSPVNVRYLTGFTGSNAQLLIGPAVELFLTDGRYTERSRHEAPDVDRCTYERSYLDELARRFSDGAIGRLGLEAGAMTVAGRAKLEAALPDVETVPLEDPVEAARVVKDDEERELLRRAQAATDAAFEMALDAFTLGMSEQRAARELERLLEVEGADGTSFDPIVAFGECAAEPHHDPSHRVLDEGDVIKLDFGALVDGYHADMTRTVSFGAPAVQLRKIHDVVREAQQAGVDTVRAGVPGSDVDGACRKVIEDAGYGDRFVHGAGHGVGLEIHEAPWLGKGRDEPHPAGAVVTVEPGIYIPGLGGVRIEDMVEVSEDGGRVVGTATRELIEL